MWASLALQPFGSEYFASNQQKSIRMEVSQVGRMQSFFLLMISMFGVVHRNQNYSSM